jgi:MFS family permease
MRSLRRPTGGLWSHPDFLKLWAGQSISEFGSQISQLAIPWLAAVGLHASPLEFSFLGVLGFLPFILFALPAGVWVDRLRRRQILIVGDAARAALLLLIPILWAADALHMWHLLVLQFVIGIFTVFFDVAYQSYLPALVER